MNNITQTKKINNAEISKPVIAYMANLATARGRAVQKQALDRIAEIISGGRVLDCLSFPWHLMRYEHTQAARARLIELYKPATVNRFLCALRGVLRAAWRVGLMLADDYQRASDLKSVTGESLLKGRELSGGELSALFGVCLRDASAAGVRDAAVIALLYGCGLRRSEVVTLGFSDYEKDAGRLRVHGKRNKERYAYIPAGAVSALEKWIDYRGRGDGALFVRVCVAGRRGKGDGLTGQSIYAMLLRRAEAAGVSNIAPHDMRRTFVSNLLDNGQDLVTVSKMAGHANVQTTARYDRRAEDTKRRAALTLNIPTVDGVTCL